MLDTLHVKSESPEFSSTFFKALRFWRHKQDGLDTMRRAYNFFVVQLLKQYGVETADIYTEFDESWAKSLEEVSNSFLDWDDMPWPLKLIHNVVNPEISLLQQTYVLRRTWRLYKDRVEQIVKRRAENQAVYGSAKV